MQYGGDRSEEPVCGGYGQNQDGVKTRSMQKALDMEKDGAVDEMPMPDSAGTGTRGEGG